MNRPMAVIGFSFFFTLVAIGLLGYIVAFWVFIVLAGVFLVAAMIFRSRLPTMFLAVIVSAMIACVLFCAYTKFVYSRAINYADSQLALTFEITEIEGEDDGTYYYCAEIAKSEHSELVGTKVRLSSSAPFDAQICDFVSATVILNIAGSDTKSSQLYYKSSGIFLKAHIFDEYTIEKNPDKSLGFYFFEIRRAISKLISANLNEESAAVVNSIFLGNTNELDYKNNMNFRNIGISHIFCVSGLHVALVSAFVCRFLSALIERKRILYGATILAIWLFVAITGFPYSSIRSAVMLSICYIGRMIYRDGDSLNSLGVAVTVLCLLNPFSATNVSLLYSFFATLGILVMPRPRLSRIRSKIIRSLIGTAVMSLNVMAFTLPIQIFFFGTATVISPLANSLIVFAIAPLMSCAMIAIILSLFTSVLSAFFFSACAVTAKYLIFVSDLIAKIPYATLDASMDFVKLLVTVIVLIFLAIAYLGLGKRANIIAAAACGAMLVSSVLCYNIFFKPVMTAMVIDSGGATSVVLTQGRNAVVIGCGGSKYTASEVNYILRQSSVREIDLLVLPTKENTEAFNIDGLVEMIDVRTAVSGEDYGLLYSLDIGNVSISNTGKYIVGEMTVSYSYTETQKLTYVEMGESSILVVSMISDEAELDEEWKTADAVISVGNCYRTNNEKVNVLCTDENGDYPVSAVCYKGGGNIVIGFMKDGNVNCERRA